MILNFVLAFASAFAISFLLVPSLIHLAHKKHLFDIPDARKKHAHPVPALGGVAIFAGFWVTSALFVSDEFLPHLRYLLVGAFLLMLVGVEDDLLTVSPRKKLIMQVIVGSILCYAGFRIESLFGLFGIGAIGSGPSYVLTILFLITLINAFNLIDGIDGLAGSLVMISSAIFGLLFYLQGAIDWSILALALSAAIFGFLNYNFYKASIFMGDNGSMILGLTIAVFSIQLLNISGADGFSGNALSLVFSLVAIPVLDLARVSVVRMLRGKSPFAADRNHIHHIFLRQGYSTPVICLSLILMESVLVGLAVNLQMLNPTVQILILTAALGVMATGFYLIKKAIDYGIEEAWN